MTYVPRRCFGELAAPLKYILTYTYHKVSFIFPDKVAKITRIYDDKTDLGNYRPILVLPCLSKILQGLMCNHLFKYLIKITFFTTSSSSFPILTQPNTSRQAIIPFEKNRYTLIS